MTATPQERAGAVAGHTTRPATGGRVAGAGPHAGVGVLAGHPVDLAQVAVEPAGQAIPAAESRSLVREYQREPRQREFGLHPRCSRSGDGSTPAWTGSRQAPGEAAAAGSVPGRPGHGRLARRVGGWR